MTTTTYNFTGANGAAIPAGLVAYLPKAGSTATIQGNQLQEVAASDTTLPEVAGFQTSVDILNPSVEITIVLPATLDSRVYRLFGRASADWNDYDNPDYGYALSLSCDANPNNLGLRSVVLSSRPVIGTPASFVCVAGHTIKMKLILSGSSITGKCWDVTAGQTEATGRIISATDTAVPDITHGGRTKFRFTNIVLSTATTQVVDDFIIDDQITGSTGVATSAKVTLAMDVGVTARVVINPGGGGGGTAVTALGDVIIGVRKKHLAVISIKGA